ncbi:4Fe-4S binding protein [Olsenella sp. YH-ols2223]|uniref:4Fe-4S binding protein n=1 Tax=Olsenella absiana TaxID=3115222 RepID=A0ABU7R7K2_9ACTN
MDVREIESLLGDYVESAEGNRVQGSYALDQALVGTTYFKRPLVRCAAADDPLFRRIRDDERVLGPKFRLPSEWLPGARSVVSVCFPMSDEVCRSNVDDLERPSDLWLHARIEGQQFIAETTRLLVGWLEERGFSAVAPSQSPDFEAVRQDRRAPGAPLYVSRWSERHVAFVAGMGTFDLSAHLITPAGKAMRLSSVVTDARLEPTERPYGEDPFAYCTRCGACVARCPVGAISLPGGKDVALCSEVVARSKERFSPRLGCGKCQLGVPCQSRIPEPRFSHVRAYLA